MSEAISFWLDNKMVSALKVAQIGGHTLVDYRGRYYEVTGGAAVMKGSKPLHFSKSSLPSHWKKAVRGDAPAAMPQEADDGIMPQMSVTRRIRSKQEHEVPAMQETPSPQPATAAPKTAPEQKRPPKPTGKPETRMTAQSTVPAHCPTCGCKQDIPVEKGKNGKPFFLTCPRCTADFAVRFVPVTMFQAQVAGFK